MLLLLLLLLMWPLLAVDVGVNVRLVVFGTVAGEKVGRFGHLAVVQGAVEGTRETKRLRRQEHTAAPAAAAAADAGEVKRLHLRLTHPRVRTAQVARIPRGLAPAAASVEALDEGEILQLEEHRRLDRAPPRSLRGGGAPRALTPRRLDSGSGGGSDDIRRRPEGSADDARRRSRLARARGLWGGVREGAAAPGAAVPFADAAAACQRVLYFLSFLFLVVAVSFGD